MSGTSDQTQNLVIAGAVTLAALVGGVAIWKLFSSKGNNTAVGTTTSAKKPARKRTSENSAKVEFSHPESVNIEANTTELWKVFEDLKQRLNFKHPESFKIERNATHPICMYRLVDTTSSQLSQSDEEGVAVIVEFLANNLSSKDYFERSKQMLVMMNQMMMVNPGFKILQERQTKLAGLDAFEIEYTQLAQHPVTGQMMHMKVYNLMYTVDNRAYCIHYSNEINSYDLTFVNQVIGTVTIPEALADRYTIEFYLPKHKLVVPLPSHHYMVDLESKSGLVTIVHASEPSAKSTRMIVSQEEGEESKSASLQDIADEWVAKIKKANPAAQVQQKEITFANSPALKLSYTDTTDRKCISIIFRMEEGGSPFVATGLSSDDAKLEQIENTILNIRTDSKQDGDSDSKPFLHYRNTEYGFALDFDPSLRALQTDFGETIASFMSNIDPSDDPTKMDELVETTVNVRVPTESSQTYDAQTMIAAILDEIDEMKQSGNEVTIMEKKERNVGEYPGFHITVLTHVEANQMQGPVDMVYHITCAVRDGQLISMRSTTTQQNFRNVKAQLDAMANTLAFFK